MLRQQLSDRDETISDLKHQIEASEATIKMLKEKDHNMPSTAAGMVKEESTTTAELPSLEQTDPSMCKY